MFKLFSRITKRFLSLASAFISHPRYSLRSTLLVPEFCRGLELADRWPPSKNDSAPPQKNNNPLWDYFTAHNKGPGIWKWTHYFEVYHRHLEKFRGRSVKLLEIGIYSGGSLPMWLSYFGNNCNVFGVDIEQACKKYENENIHVFIGDQEDREFWQAFRKSVPNIDIVIDDGGHTPEQQMTTLEELLPHMPPGSVYICEDIHGNSNRFAAFATALVHRLNTFESLVENGQISSKPSNLQKVVHSIHFYPYLLVIEIHNTSPTRLVSAKRGTEWNPFIQ
jgi:hypothetical protein